MTHSAGNPMNAETVTVRRRVVRSDQQSGGQNVMLWMCTLWVVWTIHTGSLGFENNVLIGNVLFAIGCPIAFLVIFEVAMS